MKGGRSVSPTVAIHSLSIQIDVNDWSKKSGIVLRKKWWEDVNSSFLVKTVRKIDVESSTRANRRVSSPTIKIFGR